MSLLSQLAPLIDTEFKDVLPAVNAVIEDMATDYLAWQSNPVVKATEAVTTLVNPVAAIDMQAVIGAASLVQALWQVFGAQAPAPVATTVPNPTPVVATAVVPEVLQTATQSTGATAPILQPATTLQEAIVANGGQIPDMQPSHM
jgi:hypothetical protein